MKDREKHPKMLPEPLQIFAGNGRYPSQLRVSFADGSTQVYKLHIAQPAPVLRDGLDKLTSLCTGYPPTAGTDDH